ncbi:molybdopterin-guanine dinucleotide biosynthesis protein MobA [Pseudomonas sp. S25]|uniref:Molybdopterin-guanine dinucleotide biosynthesis protein MobA n=1 Tax=Pseudomonas maioricensis TaxID=1766623 RepID=A0ABS9ZMT1_9PSED|nr:nucleotidyltransferase family protein [Pseudomonas sp. S25]MCI8211611.1 molybdopterin-guanine dinucleotide biosynthesis protein MobA [Pseudomonas sp. S25]
MTNTVCAIVLAAGEGRRFQAIAGQGQSKLLASCVGRDGIERPVLEQTLVNLQGVVDKVLVITRPDCPQIIALAHHYGCELVMLSSAGMGDSIAAAVAAEPDHRAWLIVLGDMPFILPQTLHQVVASLEDGRISVPALKTEFGHPVGFGRQYGPALKGLSGDQGARRLFKEGCVQQIEVDDPGVLWDVDVPDRLVFVP